MRIDEVYLYKTPLDINYLNVIDFNKSVAFDTYDETEMKNRLFTALSSYVSKSVYPISKAIKIEDRVARISVREDFIECREYNYAVVISNDIPYFFFINNIVSENDGVNPCSTLTLTWDSWNNNIYDIYHSKDLGEISIKHYDRSYIKNNTIYPRLINITSPQFPTIRESVGLDLPPKVIYLVLELKPVNNSYGDILKPNITTKYQRLENGEWVDVTEPTTVDQLQLVPLFENEYKKRLLYCPIGLLNQKTGRLISGSITGTNYVGTSFEFNNEMFRWIYYSKIYSVNDVYTLGSFIGGNISEYIAKAYYTVYAPFDYELDYTQGVISPIAKFKLPISYILINNEVSVPVISCIDNYLYDSGNEKDGMENVVRYKLKGEYDEFSFKYSDIFPDYPSFSISLNPTLERDPEVIEPNYSLANYYEIFFSFNGKEHNLKLPTDESNETIHFKLSYATAQPLLTIYLGYKKIYDYKGYFLDRSGLLTYSVDALDDYLIRNGSQLDVARNLNVFNTIMNGVSGMIAGSKTQVLTSIGTGIFNELKIRATLEDKSNAPSDYHSYTGEDDIYFIDRIILSLHRVDYSNNSPYIDLFLNALYTYGYESPTIDNPFSNCRTHFDFVKCENIILTSIKNSEDRQIIENVLKRGCFKNHITSDPQNNRTYFNY